METLRTQTWTRQSYSTGRQLLIRCLALGMLLATGTPLVAGEVWSLYDAVYEVKRTFCQAMKDAKLSKLAVFEFTSESDKGESLDFGLLGKFCAEEIENKMVDEQNRGFGVVDHRRLQSALKERQFTLASLDSSEALKQLGEGLDGLPAIVVGSLSGKEKGIVRLQCKLVAASSGEIVKRVDLQIGLNESEFGMLGRSVAVRAADRQAAGNGGRYFPPGKDKMLDVLDRNGKMTHPLIDPRFPYRVKIVIGGKERQGVFQGNNYFVPVRNDEVYEIWVENRSGKKTLMRLLVDGLNTLPQKEYSNIGEPIEVPTKRVNLGDARSWVLDPAKNRANLYAVRGFVTATGKKGELDLFKIVSAENSIAGRQQFTSDIGLITAAFYAPYVPPKFVRRDDGMTLGSPGGMTAGSAAPGTGSGGKYAVKLEAEEAKPGDLLAVLHIHYVGFDALPAAQP